MSLKGDVIAVGIGAAVLLAAVWYAKKRVVEAANEYVPYVDPTSDKNLAYQGSSALARWLTGQEDGSLGTILFDYVNRTNYGPNGQAPAGYNQAADQAAIQRLENGFHGM